MKVKKKILFVLHVPPPVHGSSVIGGIIKDSAVVNENFDPRFINLGTSRTIDEIGKNGLSKVSTYVKIIWSVFKQMLIFRPNVVYLAMTAKGIGFYKDAVVALIVKLSGKQLVVHFHNKGVKDRQSKFVDNLLYKLVFKKTKFILLSKYLYYDIEKYVDEKDVYYCPNGIREVEHSIQVAPVGNKDVKLLFLSNLIESKGVFVLLEALQKLKDKNIKFQCNFVGGEGDISKEIFERKVDELHLKGYVEYLGKKYDQEKNEIFVDSDIFVLPTYYHNECFPLVLLEASQFKLPLVSTDEGAIPEIIQDGVNGYIVSRKDVNALASKLELLIKDEALRQSLGFAAYEKYKQNYTLSAFETRITSILKSIN